MILVEQKRGEGVLVTPPPPLTTMRMERITGQRFGKLVAIRRHDYPRLNSTWLVQCDCGKQFIERLSRLGHVQSCGCLRPDIIPARYKPAPIARRTKKTRLYTIWAGMRRRVFDESGVAFSRYGGRGITICKEWGEFSTFKDWALSNGYALNLSIDRVDNDLGYSPNNCRWADAKTQSRNRPSHNLLYAYRGKVACLSEHAEDANMPYKMVLQRIRKLDWSLERALTEPPAKEAR